MAFFSLAKINSGEDRHGVGCARLLRRRNAHAHVVGRGALLTLPSKILRKVQEMATPLASPDSQVSDLDIAKIARKINNWKELSPFLGLAPQDETVIERSCKDYLEEKRAALHKWRDMKGKEATYRALIAAAKEAENEKLADDVQTLTAGQTATENVQQDGRAASSEPCFLAAGASQIAPRKPTKHASLFFLQSMPTSKGQLSIIQGAPRIISNSGYSY